MRKIVVEVVLKKKNVRSDDFISRSFLKHLEIKFMV